MYFAPKQEDLQLRVLRMFEGTFSLNVMHSMKDNIVNRKRKIKHNITTGDQDPCSHS